jgi:chlorite dismutase
MAALEEACSRSGMEGVLYEDANDPRGVGLLTWSDDPDFFVGTVRPFLNAGPFQELTFKPEYTMLGRTYALGHEPNLEDWLMNRSRKAVTDPDWTWHVWYPLRRKGEFNALPPEEQTSILREHGTIGHSFGTAGLAMDVRLACFGMDRERAVSAVGLCAGDAQDAANSALHRRYGTVLCGPRRVAKNTSLARSRMLRSRVQLHAIDQQT